MDKKSNRIKVLVITYIGNIIASPPIVSMISELAKNNFQVDLAYSPSKKYKEPEFKSRLIQKHIVTDIKHRLIIPGLRMFFFISGTLKLIFLRRPTYYIAIHVEALFIATVVSFFRPRPIIFYSTEIRSYSQNKHFEWKLRKYLEILCQRKVALTIVQDENRAELLKKVNKAPNAKINVIPVGFVNTFNIKKKSDDLRKKYNIPKHKYIILMSGTIANWTSSLEVVQIASTWSSNKVLIIHGKAEEKRYLEKVRKYCDGKKVILSEDFLSQDEYDKMTIAADIGLATYKNVNENIYNMGASSGKIMQYLRCGVPVITMAWPTLIEIIEKEIAGLCINNFPEIEHSIHKIMHNYKLYSDNARRIYTEKCNPEKYYNNFFKQIESLCN